MRIGASPVVRGSTAGTIHLTFDDGPDLEWTPRVLDVLAAAQARATFFVVGQGVRAAPELLRRIEAEGHEIGNHSYGHRHPWTLSEAAARDEVRRGAAAIADVLGRAPCAFRPPHGRLRRCMLDEAEQSGQRTVLWSVSAIDWGPLGHSARIEARLRTAGARDIVLMHDGRSRHNRPDELLRVLPRALTELVERGLTPTTLPA